jgi:hypothetical protein
MGPARRVPVKPRFAHGLQKESDSQDVVTTKEKTLTTTSRQDVVTWVPFGKWMISPDRLKNEDILSIARADHGKVPKHPNRVVSAAMKICLGQIIAGEPISMELLSHEDQEWLKWLMDDAHIAFKKKPVTKLTIARTPKQIRDRLSVLYGEISEGPNDHPGVKAEFKILFNQASIRGLLKDQQLINLQQFISTFE